MICLECGIELSGKDGEIGTDPECFCTKEHKTAFDMRRYKRGALVHDMLMRNRYKRKLSAERAMEHVYGLISLFRDEDKAERGGRQSWRTPDNV